MFYYRRFEFQRRWREYRGAERGWAVLPPQKFFLNLDLQIETIDTFWVLFFSQFSCLFYPEADEFSLLLMCTISSFNFCGY